MDNVSKSKRSWIMSRIRSRGTKPEKAVHEILRRLRIAVLSHVEGLPGKPDFVVPACRTAILVHGCFFHGCPAHYKAPKSNVDFWAGKVQANMRRDVRVVKALWRRDWHVVRVWEHSLRPDRAKSTAERLLRRLRRNACTSGFTGLRMGRRCDLEAGKHA